MVLKLGCIGEVGLMHKVSFRISACAGVVGDCLG